MLAFPSILILLAGTFTASGCNPTPQPKVQETTPEAETDSTDMASADGVAEGEETSEPTETVEIIEEDVIVTPPVPATDESAENPSAETKPAADDATEESPAPATEEKTATEEKPVAEGNPAADEKSDTEEKTATDEKPAVAGENEVALAVKAKPAAADAAADEALAANADVGPKDWPQWGGSKKRNNVPHTTGVALEWNIGKFDRETGDWIEEDSENIKWVARLGSQTYGNPVIANGKILVGTNNGAGWVKRFPPTVDLGCLLCFRESDGQFLWQHSNAKLSTGRVHDWPLQGVCSSALIEGKRCWYVSNRGEVVCLDMEGFHDGENNGPVTDEPYADKDDADIIWRFNMMEKLNISQHNMCSCSVTALGDILFVNTSNGLDESHVNLPSPDAPTFLAMNKNTGEIYWSDASPGNNILHGQWSSPAVAKLGGLWQVIFAAGDGWIYGFEANEGKDGKPILLWKFDANPKETKWILGGTGTRNNIIATPVIYDGLVYIAVGQDPEHGEGVGQLWCIDPTKRGDVSPELAFNINDLKTPIPHKRIQAVVKEEGEVARPNPNSAAVWHYSQQDIDEDGDLSFEETMYRSIGTATIKNDLLVIADFSGLVHCFDAKTGKPNWTYDMLAASWGSALIAGDKILIGDEDGDVSIFNLSADPAVAMNDGEPIATINMGNSVYSSPIVANDVLYIANKTHLFAIRVPGAEVAAEATEEKPAEAAATATEGKPAEAASAEEKTADVKKAPADAK
jgi:outer membrane protein assembly factor BamB